MDPIPFFFDPDRGLALVLNAIILTLTVVALLLLLFQELRNLRAERLAVKRLQGTAIGLGREAQEALKDLGTRLPQNTALAARLRDLREMHLHRREIDSAALSALTVERFRRQLTWPTYIAGSLVLLGLAGTLWGLSVGVSELSKTLSGTGLSTEYIRLGILTTLGGMKTAFSTTLAGVIGALVTTGAITRFRYKQSAVFEDLDQILTTRVIPVYQVSPESSLGEAARHLSTLQDELKSHFHELFLGLSSSFESIDKSFGERATELLRSVDDVRDAVLRILGDRADDAPSLADYVETVRLTTTALEKNVEQVGLLMPSLTDSLVETIKREQAAVEQTLQDQGKEIERLLGEQTAAAEALKEAARVTAEHLGKLERASAELGRFFNDSKEAWERSDQALRTIGTNLEGAFRDGLRDVLDQSERLVTSQTAMQERVFSALAEFERHLKETLAGLQDQTGRHRRLAEEQLLALRDALRVGFERLSAGLSETSTDSSRTIQVGLRDMARELRALSGLRTLPIRSLKSPAQQPDMLSPDGTGDTHAGGLLPATKRKLTQGEEPRPDQPLEPAEVAAERLGTLSSEGGET